MGCMMEARTSHGFALCSASEPGSTPPLPPESESSTYCAAVGERTAGNKDESLFQLDLVVVAMRVRTDMTGSAGVGFKSLMSGPLELSDDPIKDKGKTFCGNRVMYILGMLNVHP